MPNQLFSSYQETSCKCCFIITRALKRDTKLVDFENKKSFRPPNEKIRFSVLLKAPFEDGAKPPNINNSTLSFLFIIAWGVVLCNLAPASHQSARDIDNMTIYSLVNTYVWANKLFSF